VPVTGLVNYREPPVPAFLFDLDGTLIDSVYQNVIAWRNALATVDIDLSVWRIHRRIGMSGGLFISALLRETGRTLSEADIEAVQQAHGAGYLAQIDSVRPLPGAAELLAALTDRGVPCAIATTPPQRREACPADAETARRYAHGHQGHAPARQAGPRPVPGRRRGTRRRAATRRMYRGRRSSVAAARAGQLAPRQDVPFVS
jgi:hypothetical protein